MSAEITPEQLRQLQALSMQYFHNNQINSNTVDDIRTSNSFVSAAEEQPTPQETVTTLAEIGREPLQLEPRLEPVVNQEISGEEVVAVFIKESTELDKDIFLEQVRKYRCLWDTNVPSYKERQTKANAWRELAGTFNKNVEFLQRCLKNLRDNLKKCLDKRTRMTMSGAASSSLPKCKYFEQMAFLHEKSANKPTESNLEIDLSPQASGSREDVSPCSTDTSQSESLPPMSSSSKKRLFQEQCCKPNKKSSKHDAADLLLLKHLEETDDALKKTMHDDEGEDALYCRSLIPVMKQLPLRKKRLAKIKISQILFDIEFNEQDY